MENIEEKYKHIKGWGIDADPKNEPTYPMKKWTGDDHDRLSWNRPTLQPVNIEVLHSNERPHMTAVFGATYPPTGLSGMIRRFAFKYSEDSYGHWVPLILADRINVVEGIIDDIKNGFFPNILAEKGMKADVQHDKKGLAIKTLVATAITSALAFYIYKKICTLDKDRYDQDIEFK